VYLINNTWVLRVRAWDYDIFSKLKFYSQIKATGGFAAAL
jgi:hypothetical protein